MEEILNYDPVEPSDSEIERIKLDDESTPTLKSRGRPRKQPVKEQDPDKPKRIQSEHQKANFQKCLEARKRNIQMRKQLKAEQAHNI